MLQVGHVLLEERKAGLGLLQFAILGREFVGRRAARPDARGAAAGRGLRGVGTRQLEPVPDLAGRCGPVLDLRRKPPRSLLARTTRRRRLRGAAGDALAIGVEVAAGVEVEVGLVIGAAIDFSIVLDTGSGMYRYGVAPALKEKKEKHENKGKDKMGY